MKRSDSRLNECSLCIIGGEAIVTGNVGRLFVVAIFSGLDRARALGGVYPLKVNEDRAPTSCNGVGFGRNRSLAGCATSVFIDI